MFLSIIVPVYNVASSLRECITSLCNQDLPADAYEVICIDDGSTDDSLSILRELASVHPMLRVIQQKNAGVSAARNQGIVHAIGEYIWFVDSDDLIVKDTLKELQTIAADSGADRIAFNYYEIKEQFTPEERAAYEAGALEDPLKYRDLYVWSSILRRELMERYLLRFRNTAYGEDSLFMFEYLTHVEKQIDLPAVKYVYRRRASSATTVQSEEAERKRFASRRYNATVLRDYYEGKNGPVPDRERCANQFMTYLLQILYMISQMPRKEAKRELSRLRADGLFPYPFPPECTHKRSYQTTRTDWYGKLFDKLYLRMTT